MLALFVICSIIQSCQILLDVTMSVATGLSVPFDKFFNQHRLMLENESLFTSFINRNVTVPGFELCEVSCHQYNDDNNDLGISDIVFKDIAKNQYWRVTTNSYDEQWNKYGGNKIIPNSFSLCRVYPKEVKYTSYELHEQRLTLCG